MILIFGEDEEDLIYSILAVLGEKTNIYNATRLNKSEKIVFQKLIIDSCERSVTIKKKA